MSKRLAIVLALCAGLAGCGNSRTPAPQLGPPAAPGGFTTAAFPDFTVGLPKDWRISPAAPPAVVVAQSSLATLAIWRYPRTTAAPGTRATLKRALSALVAATRARDPSFIVTHARVAPIARHGGLELVGTATIDGQRRAVRSTHFFVNGNEIVVDAYAPLADFPRTDQLVFLPVVYSLALRR